MSLRPKRPWASASRQPDCHLERRHPVMLQPPQLREPARRSPPTTHHPPAAIPRNAQSPPRARRWSSARLPPGSDSTPPTPLPVRRNNS
eukprot:1358868-Pleurochrysis_carterae.AAC.1